MKLRFDVFNIVKKESFAYLKFKICALKFSQAGFIRLTKKSLVLLLAVSILLPSFSYLFLFKLPKPAKAEWYDETWAYRQRITLTNNTGSAQTNLQKLLTIDTASLTTDKLQADCDDLRFTDSGGNLLSYYIDSGCDSASTKVWVLIPSLPTGTSNIYMYYGNPSAQAGSSSADFDNLVGLVGYWTMNDSSGNTVTDSSINSNNGTATDATTGNGDGNTPPSVTTGQKGNTRDFDGTDDYVSASAMNNTGNVTYEAWVNVDSLGALNMIFEDWATNTGSLRFYIATTGKLHTDIRWSSGGGYYQWESTNAVVSAGQWYHLAITQDSTPTVKIYVNGSEVAVTTTYNGGTPSFPITGTGVNIGRVVAGSVYLNGKVDDLKVYNTARTAAQIADDYNKTYTIATAGVSVTTSSGSEEKGPGPVAYWRFDDSQGQVAQDSTTNNNDGTLGASTASGSDDPSWQTEDMCVAGKCLKYDGTNDYVNVANTVTGTQTVAMWVRPTSTTASLVTLNGTTSISATSGTISATGFTSPTIYVNGKVSSTLAANTWQHVAVTTGTAISASTIKIGNVSTSYITGFIDDVKIYNYARSASQIQSDYAQGSVGQGLTKGISAGLGRPASQSKALSDGLVGYWKMDEASWTNNCSTTSVTDSSGNGNNGQACPATTGPTGGAAGKFGNAGSFDGSDDYVNAGSGSGLDITNTITLAAWVNFTSTSGVRRILVKNNSGTANGYYLDSDGTNVNFRFYDSGGALRTAAYATSNFSTSTWYHLTGTFNGSTLRLYVNGGLVSSTQFSGSIASSTAALFIGMSGGSADNFSGSIDEARIYNRALTPSEVEGLYNFAPGPVGYWDFEDGSGSTAADKSGNGNNGTLTVGASGTQTTTSQAWTAGTPGKIGGALNFDGSDDYVSVGDPTVLDFERTNPFSIGAWVKTTSADTRRIVGKLAGGNNPGYVLYLESAVATVQIINTWNTNAIQVVGTTAVNDNKWHYIYVTYDGSSSASGVKLYVDGKLETTSAPYDSLSASILNNSNLEIGRCGSGCGAQPFNGSIDDVRIYNYARSQKQVIEDMGGGHPSVIASGGGPSTGSGRAGGAVAYYKFDEGYGTTTNNSGYGGSTLNGTLSGMASPATSTSGWTQAGKYNKGLVFDGSDDYVDVADNNAFSPTSLTLSAWVYPTTTNNGQATITGKGYTEYELSMEGTGPTCSGTNVLLVYIGGASDKLCGSRALTLNTWAHVVVTYDGSTIKSYLNGVLDTTQSNSVGISNGTNSLKIGARSSDNTWPFTGSIDEVKIYPFALTAEEVKLEYNRGSATVLGALGDNTNYDKSAQNQEYCIPGDTSTCTAPVGRWDFEENNGQTANDTSGNANNGTLGASTAVGTDDPTWAVGKKGAGLSFDGVDDYVDAGAGSTVDITGNFTIGAWVKFDTLPTNNPHVVGKIADYQGYGLFYYGNTGQGVGGIIGTGSGWVFTPFHIPSTGRWYHYVAVYNGTNFALYVDGTLQGTPTSNTTNPVTTTNNVLIGKHYSQPGAGYWLDGSIDDVRIFNYARSAAQIAWDYNRGAPVGWWKFDEGQGGTAYDSSGNGNNGTWNGTAAGTQTSVGDINTSGTAWFNGKTGKRNYSLNFDGSDDYVEVTNESSFDFDRTQNFTISAWIKPNTHTAFGSIVSKMDVVSGTYRGFDFSIDNAAEGGSGCANCLRLLLVNTWATDALGVDTTTAVSTGSWSHVAITYDGSGSPSGVKFYINGVQESSTTTRVNTLTSTTVNNITPKIGNRNSQQYFNGPLDDVRIYNYALTGTQVKLLYNDGAVRFGPSTGTP